MSFTSFLELFGLKKKVAGPTRKVAIKNKTLKGIKAKNQKRLEKYKKIYKSDRLDRHKEYVFFSVPALEYCKNYTKADCDVPKLTKARSSLTAFKHDMKAAFTGLQLAFPKNTLYIAAYPDNNLTYNEKEEKAWGAIKTNTEEDVDKRTNYTVNAMHDWLKHQPEGTEFSFDKVFFKVAVKQ